MHGSGLEQSAAFGGSARTGQVVRMGLRLSDTLPMEGG